MRAAGSSRCITEEEQLRKSLDEANCFEEGERFIPLQNLPMWIMRNF
ncbi:hypothetical protein ACPOL_5331 [Acidisarcina polymorpha]|uniref:Uncharacterized protein n=1 Tax=Acidisarcina polymorpha TaxID=2211140 RepID=A0A2Z5G655_9BACT|nr:hypothetical protein ACPOL_5331 [Acidisarcina polymorpha]